MKSGRAARFFIRGLALGAPAGMQEVFDDPDHGNYLLTGFQRLGPDILKMMAVLTQSAKPAERLLCSMLKDDRMLMRVHDLQEDFLGDIAAMPSIGDFAWARLAALAGVSGAEVRHATL